MDEAQLPLFPELDGMGDGRALRDVEYIHTRAKKIINQVPEASISWLRASRCMRHTH